MDQECFGVAAGFSLNDLKFINDNAMIFDQEFNLNMVSKFAIYTENEFLTIKANE